MATTYAATETRRRAIPLGVIPYSQSTISPYTDRRADCSGLISYVWDLRKTGPGTWLNAFTTQSLWEQGLIKEIPRTELRAGDAIGKCGPGTANGGGGHIALYMSNKGDQYRVWDHGSGMGPKDRFVTWNAQSTGWLAPGNCKAWRYVHITDGTEEDDVFCKYGDTGNNVSGLQAVLQMLGHLPTVDGQYGDKTATALAAALAPWVGGDPSGRTYWAGEYAQLQRAVAQKFGGAGTPGPAGPAGPKGATGATGPAGPAGPAGAGLTAGDQLTVVVAE